MKRDIYERLAERLSHESHREIDIETHSETDLTFTGVVTRFIFRSFYQKLTRKDLKKRCKEEGIMLHSIMLGAHSSVSSLSASRATGQLNAKAAASVQGGRWTSAVQRQQLALYRRRNRRCSAASEQTITEESSAPDAKLAKEPLRKRPVAKNWEELLELKKKGETVDTTVTEVNRGGAVVKVKGVSGFVPFGRMDLTRLQGDGAPESAVSGNADGEQLRLLQEILVGQAISGKIIECDKSSSTLVLSEQEVLRDTMLRDVKEGQVVECVVRNLVDYGAFAAIRSKDGNFHSTDALIHLSELSWDFLVKPEQRVRVGDELQCLVIAVDHKKGRISLSLKQMQADPLKETLTGLLPLVDGGPNLEGTVPVSIPQSIEEVVGELAKEDGIDSIALGRQVSEQRTVAQDLEIYVSTKEVPGGFILVARAGRVVQEISIVTTLPPQELKAAMQRALKRLM